ncbi:MAG: arginine--tRNA ligase [Candidatus Omnitrophica bacterium]|jgi:arginyl-tRNA synthetase|nr:arginine--tRNA ligase [Candidatus Omnitrophota bacterium]
MRGFYEKVSYILDKIIREDYAIILEPPLWELPSRQEYGDLSSMVALRLASELKKDPLEIAVHIQAVLKKFLNEDIEKVEILKPGFINIFIAKGILIDSLNEILKYKEDFFRSQRKKRILIEFLSANPTGPLSIAHGRQAVIGDVIAKVLEFLGNKVKREYYLNDEGNQIELLISSVDARAKEIKGKDFIFPENGYKGEYIKDIAKELIRKKKKDIRNFSLDYIITMIKKDLLALDIRFDSWFSQKKLLKEGKVEEAIDRLKNKDLIYEEEGALWFAATKFGDDKDRVIKKADGELTYFASDIAYHRDKINRNYDELINLWGPDHHGYIKRVKTALYALDYKKEVLKVIIIQLVTLKTKERMSKRAGTFVLLSDLINDIGKDATRFYYLTRKNSSHLEFDLDLAKKASFDNPLYYIQYVCARIESIFKKAKVNSFEKRYNNYLKEEEEFILLRQLLQFVHCLDKVYYSLEPVFIIEFLKSLAAGFHKFYEKIRVIDNDKNLTQARLNLIEAVRIVFYCGLNLLGIKPAKKM